MKRIIVLLICVFMLFATISGVLAAFDERCENANEYYLDGTGCVEPKMSYTTTISATNDKAATASSLEAIAVSNPWAAQGQPVVVKFTLSNIGDQYSYPYNQIPLSPDSYVLLMGVDKDIGIINKDGKIYNIWNDYMNVWDKLVFLVLGSSGEFIEKVKIELKGQQCGYVNVYSYMTQRVKDKVVEVTGGASMLSWQCLKIVDMPYFSEKISSMCPDGIDNACIAKINQDSSVAASDTVQVMLSSTHNGDIPRGECIRPSKLEGIWGSLAKITQPSGKWNLVKCSIGDEGLKPGESVTFNFVVFVPRDAPIVSAKEQRELYGIKGLDESGFGGYTESYYCNNDKNAKACHSVYAAVYPMKTETFLSKAADGLNGAVQIGSCTLKMFLEKTNFNDCLSAKGFGAGISGEPIYEGVGIFYVIGPVLKGAIEMILWIAVVAGGLTGLFLKTGKQ